MDNMALYNDLQTVASTSHTRNPAPPSAPILHYSVGSRWHGPPGDTAMPCTINTIHPESAVKAYSIHDTERLDLLRYYRYNVAPWVSKRVETASLPCQCITFVSSLTLQTIDCPSV